MTANPKGLAILWGYSPWLQSRNRTFTFFRTRSTTAFADGETAIALAHKDSVVRLVGKTSPNSLPG